MAMRYGPTKEIERRAVTQALSIDKQPADNHFYDQSTNCNAGADTTVVPRLTVLLQHRVKGARPPIRD